MALSVLPFLVGRWREHPDERPTTLGSCPACGAHVAPDGHAIRLHGAFFHTDCALYRRKRVA